MNNINTNNQTRTFGYWLKAADRFRSDALRAALENAGASRGEWQLLRILDGSFPGSKSTLNLDSALNSASDSATQSTSTTEERATSHPMRARKLSKMIARGWVVKEGEAWVLTGEGREFKNRLDLVVEGVQAQISEAVSADDLEVTQRTLEQIARTFGWEAGLMVPRAGGRRHRGRRYHGGGDHSHSGHQHGCHSHRGH